MYGTSRDTTIVRFIGFAALIAAGLAGCEAPPQAASEADSEGLKAGPEIKFTDAKILIEHNATAEDTGFQVFLDGEPWKQVTLTSPDKEAVLEIKPKGPLKELGLTELFFETNEPPNAEVPIAELLAEWPAGVYKFEGRNIDGVKMTGRATLSHVIPVKPEILTPAEGAAVDPTNTLVVSWKPVTQSLSGVPLKIVSYQVLVAKVLDPVAPILAGFSKPVFTVHLPGTVTSVTVPKEFWVPGTPYELEVLALEEGGAQTITVRALSTK